MTRSAVRRNKVKNVKSRYIFSHYNSKWVSDFSGDNKRLIAKFQMDSW